MSTEPTKEAAFFTTIRAWGLVRSPRRVLGGVIAGIGQRIGMAPAPARLLFVVIAIVTGGLSLLVYAAAWALLPDSQGRIVVQDFGRGRPNVGALVLIVILGIIGLSTLGQWGLWGWNRARLHGPFDGNIHIPAFALVALLIPVGLVAGIVWLVVWSVRSGNAESRAATHYAALPDGTIPQGPTPQGPTPQPDAMVAEEAAVPAAVPTAAVVAASAEPATASGTAEPAAPEPAPTSPPVYAAVPPYQGRDYSFSVKPRLVGPGKMGYLFALALIPITLAITLYLHSSGKLAVFPVIAAGVIYVAGLGLILLVNALRGRKGGFLAFVSVVALIPVGLSIAYADDLRDQYASGDSWRGWVRDEFGPPVEVEPSPGPVETVGAFDPSARFFDYATVAIDGQCYDAERGYVPDVNGTVRLSSIPADQTVTVTSAMTRLVVPRGTNVTVQAVPNDVMGTSAEVNWPDRGVSCGLNDGTTTGVTLANPGSPVLTVRLDDAQNNGSMSLWIEEN